MYKTLEDLKRVIDLVKPEKVIDMFSDSYLMGIAMRPFFDAEKEYSDLLLLEDKETEPAIVDDDGNELAPEINYNEIRDDLIAELEAEYPYLKDPDQTFHQGVIGYGDDLGEILGNVPDYMPSLEERRPDVEPASEGLISDLIVQYKSHKRDAALGAITHDFGDGRVIQVRHHHKSKDVLSISSEIAMLERAGLLSTHWWMEDNAGHDVTAAELKTAIESAQDQSSRIWKDFMADIERYRR